ncbi:TetR/AcrR family transcriptional regulator [Bacillus kwashiorkori]|uniref:TetR/AcrR family transcriptional regulator n=1 Tax=Bacillus kwashiorkori TaxID=1522318 RepID=UPI000782D368|nr:TetR-like C-terminal domain-containing protein [Bacillus kwashiorkori]
MSNSKLDRRKKYTRMVLKESLIKLLKEKPIFSITVKEICELADINRSTFYSHYSDQYDLLEKMEEEIIEDMYMYLSQYNFAKEEETLQMTEKLLEYLASKWEICQILLSENNETTFENKVMTVAKNFIIKNHSTAPLDESFSDYLSTFIISGSIHMIKNWLKNGMDKSPKEMAGFLYTLINKRILSL